MKAPAFTRRTAVVLVGAALLLPIGCGSPFRPSTSAAPDATTVAPIDKQQPSTTQPVAASPKAPKGVPEASGQNVNEPPSVGVPKALTIASIGVRSTLQPLGLAPDGTAQVPDDPQRAGWFTGGARPGDAGPAVILGHIDSRTGPAVFYRLHDLRHGATVTVDTTAGKHIDFTVDHVEQVPKNAFPTADVYGPAFGRQLRLITCGGTFDRTKGHYRDNVIVYLTAKKAAGRT